MIIGMPREAYPKSAVFSTLFKMIIVKMMMIGRYHDNCHDNYGSFDNDDNNGRSISDNLNGRSISDTEEKEREANRVSLATSLASERRARNR